MYQQACCAADENTPTRNYNLQSMRAWRRPGFEATRTLCKYSCSPIRLQNGLWRIVRDPTHLKKMTAEATDPCVAAATKAAQALGCVVLKLEQPQVIIGVLRGRDVFAVCLLATERRCVTPSHPLRSTSSILAVYHQLLLLTAIMRDQASGWLHASPCCSMCPCMRDVNLLLYKLRVHIM